MSEKVYLYLATGQEFQAESFAHPIAETYISEIVFNTSMYGYQEVLTDPSYCDQSIVMTYPLIGNYGINKDDSEAIVPRLKTLIVKEYCEHPANFRSEETLAEFLKHKKIHALAALDTRQLTRMIREQGTMKCLISPHELSKEERSQLLQEKLLENQIERISTQTISHFPNNGGKRIILLDFGYKKNILESLLKRNCDVIVVPFDCDFDTIKGLSPAGILLSNGPGDPKSIESVIPKIKKLQEHYPMFSICMGHQIFALANGANTEKMKFGHRGGNHPVQDVLTKKVFITAQNHGYCVNAESLFQTPLEITHFNLNDKSIEGLKHKELPAFSVQFHPEANPGPHDTKYLFDQFMQLIASESDHA